MVGFINRKNELRALENRKSLLPFEFMDIGRWWHKTEEIDIITLNKEKLKGMGYIVFDLGDF